MQITSFLWFDSKAEEAVTFYLSVLGMQRQGN
jgi:predicted 3-demethylubiquinone-9 3-methyltransferase (glyoxalase superfamily)